MAKLAFPMNDHIVFSVGGALGAAQIGKWAQVHRYYKPKSFYGSSVGALNAAMCATGQLDSAVKIWTAIRDKDVYKRKFSAANAALSIALDRAMLDIEPLRRLMADHLLGRVLRTSLAVQYVSYDGILNTVKYQAGQRIDGSMLKAIEYSCAIPFAFPTMSFADGGLIKPIPLGAAIDNAKAGDRMVIVSCHPVTDYTFDDMPDSQADKLGRTLKIMQAALVRASVNRFLEINQLMKDNDMNEWHYKGRTYKRFLSEIYAPLEPLTWGMLDFTNSRVDAANLLHKM